MIAKGHDFPGVTLVGVISADVGLGLADFRAAERTFQLLTQVAGRAGRGERPGEAVIQTLYPEHYSVLLACRQDYPGFFEKEINFRRGMRYPPLVAMVNSRRPRAVVRRRRCRRRRSVVRRLEARAVEQGFVILGTRARAAGEAAGRASRAVLPERDAPRGDASGPPRGPQRDAGDCRRVT